MCPGTYIDPRDGIRYCVLTGEEPDCDACDLDAGMDVMIVCRGHVRDVSAPFKLKDKSHSGRVVLAVEVVERVTEIRRNGD